MKTGRRSSVLKFCSHWGPMLTRTKKKIVKIWKLKILKGLEIWWRGSYPQNLACIHAAVSEKLEFTGRRTTEGRRTEGRTTDACAMWQARCDSSSADKVKQLKSVIVWVYSRIELGPRTRAQGMRVESWVSFRAGVLHILYRLFRTGRSCQFVLDNRHIKLTQ